MDISRYISIKGAHRMRNEKDAEERRRLFFEGHPQMRKLADEMISAQLELSLQTIHEADTKEAARKIAALSKKWKAELKKLGADEREFEPVYDCKDCGDTGYVGGELCKCLRKMMAEDFREEYELAHMLATQNFQKFDPDVFDAEPSIEIRNRFISQRELMQLNLERAKAFVSKFPCGESLLFIGGTGLGKTFLANCIADAVISKGYPVVYHRYIGLEMLLNEQMSFARSEDSSEKFQLLNRADLLIIDDLCPARFESLASSLFEIIDIRQANNQSTIITTNLSPSDIATYFGERFHSRLQRYTTYTFHGRDARRKNPKGKS